MTTETHEGTPEALARLNALAPIFGVDPDAPAAITETVAIEVPQVASNVRRKSSASEADPDRRGNCIPDPVIS